MISYSSKFIMRLLAAISIVGMMAAVSSCRDSELTDETEFAVYFAGDFVWLFAYYARGVKAVFAHNFKAACNAHAKALQKYHYIAQAAALFPRGLDFSGSGLAYALNFGKPCGIAIYDFYRIFLNVRNYELCVLFAYSRYHARAQKFFQPVEGRGQFALKALYFYLQAVGFVL